MGEVIRLAAPVAASTQRGCNVDDNARTGFRLFYRSMKNAAWYRDVAKKAVMFHLILEVVHESKTAHFGKHVIHLERGQLVCSARSFGDDCGLSEDQVRRALEFFEQEGAIKRTGQRGKGGYTIVSLCNFEEYQSGAFRRGSTSAADFNSAPALALGDAPAEFGELSHLRGLSRGLSAENVADYKLAPALALSGDAAEYGADNPPIIKPKTRTCIDHKDKDLKHSSSQLADATFDQQSEQRFADEPVTADLLPDDPAVAEPKTRVIPGAAIQTPIGKSWGTAEDLTTAQWMFKRVQVIAPTALEPNWAQWANVIRLMRELDQRSHRDICEQYDWVSRDAFWCANVLSPQKLRQKWDQLTAKRNAAPVAAKAMGNLAKAQEAASVLRDAGVTYDRNTPL